MPACEVRECSVAEIFGDPDAEMVFAENSAECANRYLRNARPRRESYERLEEMGFAKCFGVFRGSPDHLGRLAGYAFLLAATIPHNDQKVANVESLFVLSDAPPWAGLRLMELLEAAARDMGCEAILYSATVAGRLHSYLARRDQIYHLTNFVYTRSLR